MENSEFLGLKVSDDLLNRLDLMSNKLSLNRSTVVRKMINVCLDNEFYFSINDIINKAKSDGLVETNGLIKLLQEYINHVNSNLNKEIINETLQFIRFLQNNIHSKIESNIKQTENNQTISNTFFDAE